DFENGHAEIPTSSLYTYSVCARHLDYNIRTESLGNFINLFYLISMNNSAVWTSQSSIYEEPSSWLNVDISSDGGVFSYQINVTSPGVDYVCVASIDKDDVYGSHIGDCSSSLPDKLWVRLI
ncbi:hypothetical protein JXM83_02300, partial [Candidatus Woesearchaeota archaeon]|nr:hypothetical protein [Candidatus Woesearchaeota archaeon]